MVTMNDALNLARQVRCTLREEPTHEEMSELYAMAGRFLEDAGHDPDPAHPNED